MAISGLGGAFTIYNPTSNAPQTTKTGNRGLMNMNTSNDSEYVRSECSSSRRGIGVSVFYNNGFRATMLNTGRSFVNSTSSTEHLSQKLDSSDVENDEVSENLISELLRDRVGKDTTISSYKGISYGLKDNINYETENYKITQDEKSGYITIYDKKADAKVVMHSADDIVMQTDDATGTKVLINDFGIGFYRMVQVGDELEDALKQALDTDTIKEQSLTGFQVHTDQKTGINYITANGYESRGGQLLLDDVGREKLTFLASEFMNQYPQLINSMDEAIMYAAFEITGVAKRTDDGIMMLGPNSLSFHDKNGKDIWSMIFDEQDYESIRKEWDSKENASEKMQMKYWESIFLNKKINYTKNEIKE